MVSEQLSNVRSNVRTRCAERKEERREPAVLESGESVMAACLSSQPFLVVSPVGLHLQGHRLKGRGDGSRQKAHTSISHASGGEYGMHLKPGDWYLPRQFL